MKTATPKNKRSPKTRTRRLRPNTPAPPPGTLKARKLQTLDELRDLQRLAGAVIMNPLNKNWEMQKRWIDQRDMRVVTAEFIKPNDRLTSFERIEIYNKQYWFRLVDSLHQDFPGLLRVLGQTRFTQLLLAYLKQNPSRSFTMRNLSAKMPSFISANPQLVGSKLDLARDMARFEWAQVEAFDGPALSAVSVDDLLGRDPNKLRLRLQPYLTILDIAYPLDDFVLSLKQDNLRGEASNAVEKPSDAKPTRKRKAILPRRKQTFVVVHRHENSLYYKRLEPDAYRVLSAIAAGQTVTQAISAARGPIDAQQIQTWFANWSALGWLCLPARKSQVR